MEKMIKQTELRIGNYVKMVDSECEIITLKHLTFIVKSEAIGMMHPFEPIPITEEWLLRFGFKVTKYTPNLYEYNLSCTPPNYKDQFRMCAMFGETRDTVGKISSIRWMTERSREYRPFPYKYVHQLQNLYFALTGEDLTLKE